VVVKFLHNSFGFFLYEINFVGKIYMFCVQKQ